MLRVLTDRLYLSFVGVLAVLLLTVAHLITGVLKIPLSGSTEITVNLASTGGLFEGSVVTYRGKKVGKITTLELHGSGVRARAALRSDDRIPADLDAVVRSLSPVGEQYLDLQPRRTGGPYLTAGMTIPASAVDLPQALGETVISVSNLLDQIDEDNLRVLLRELSTGLAGTGQELGRMVEHGELLLTDMEELWPTTERLLTNAEEALDILPTTKAQLGELATYSRRFARFLKNYDPELRQTLTVLPGQVKSLHAMITDASVVVPGFLGAALRFSGFFMPYEPHLRGLLRTYAPGLGTLSDAVGKDGLQIIAYPLAHDRCDYGLARRSPKSTERRAMSTTGDCATSRRDYQRGAQYAPGPLR